MAMTLDIIKYIAEEVERQCRGPVQVSWMCDAWAFAQSCTSPKPSLEQIKRVAHLIEREKNDPHSWRRVGVRVGYHIAPRPQELPDLMDKWIQNVYQMTPEEAYKEFELIHPFVDGNGRTGKVIFNWLKGTLDRPVMPPNFFGGIP